MRYSHKIVSMIACAVVGSGCSATLNPAIPSPSGGRAFNDPVAASKSAKGMPNPIGHGTFTVFAIKVADVGISNGDGAELVMGAFQKTLEAHGYRVVEPEMAAGLPVFECRVRRFDFKNYTWFFPIVPTWGGIDIDLQVTDGSGRELWKKSYTGGSWNLWYSFSSAVNAAMEEVLEQAVEDFANPQFRTACCSNPAP